MVSVHFDADLFLSLCEREYTPRILDEEFSYNEMSRAKHWCFTLNNYTENDIERITANASFFDYVIFGREVGDSGTPHLQGFVSFPSRVRLNNCVETVGQAHFTVARNVDHSIQYCKKDGDFVEIGTKPIVKGTRNDLESFKQAVLGGEKDMKKLRQSHSDVCARYPKFCTDFVQDHLDKPIPPLYPLRPWQQTLNDALRLPPDARSIFFVVDYVGNGGKSWFGHYYCFLHDNAQVLLPGKKADMSFALNPGIRVLFIDAPRSKQGEFIQYDFLEDVKNGYVFCPKYESKIKYMTPCHVVVFMNEDPDMNKLSKDRYVIKRIADYDAN